MKKNFKSVKETAKKANIEPERLLKEINYLDDWVVSSLHRKVIGLKEGIHIVSDESDNVVDYEYHKTVVDIATSTLKPCLSRNEYI